MSAGSRFPDPRLAPADEPLAWGGDLELDTLVDAYTHGIFPWPVDDVLWWWSPDPRAVLPLETGVRLSRSLRRTLRRGEFRCTHDTAFAEVVAACADRRGSVASTADSTWITPAMQAAYRRLHAAGVAHSVEVWDGGGALVGGLYGVTLGGAFMGESMFSRASDASKVALVWLTERLRRHDFVLLDAQLPTPHLTSLGAVTLPRSDFLDRLAAAVVLPRTF